MAFGDYFPEVVAGDIYIYQYIMEHTKFDSGIVFSVEQSTADENVVQSCFTCADDSVRYCM
jgi:hypothetical protein